MRPHVIIQEGEGEAGVERVVGFVGAVALAAANVDVAVLDAEEKTDADCEAVGSKGEAAEGALVAVDAGGEGGVVACGEGVGGFGEEGDDRGGAVVNRGELQGSVTAATGCAQRQWVLADHELDNGGVAVGGSSEVKGRAPVVAAGDGQQAPLPRVDLSLRDHQLIEFQWRRAATGAHDSSESSVLGLVEELIG